ncbi:hypothetical protein Tco_1102304 [Tanacetum coccineum]
MASMVNSINTIVPETQEQDVNMLDQNAANVMAISATNTKSPINVQVDVEQCASATTAQMDRIWVDLVYENENILDDATNEKDEAGIDIQDSESLSDENMEDKDDLEDFIDDTDADEDSTDEEDTDDDYIDEEATDDDF